MKPLRSRNFYFRIVLIACLGIIIFFQLEKRELSFKESFNLLQYSEKPGIYDKLFEYFPVYKDSVYYVYITKIENKNELLFLKKDTINTIQKESKFFVHVYPYNDGLLSKNQNFLTYDFKSNFTQHHLRGRKVFIAEMTLPPIRIEKINAGQYGFRGDSRINYRIKNLLVADKIKKNLEDNNIGNMQIFNATK